MLGISDLEISGISFESPNVGQVEKLNAMAMAAECPEIALGFLSEAIGLLEHIGQDDLRNLTRLTNLNMGRILAKLGHSERAVACWERCLEISWGGQTNLEEICEISLLLANIHENYTTRGMHASRVLEISQNQLLSIGALLIQNDENPLTSRTFSNALCKIEKAERWVGWYILGCESMSRNFQVSGNHQKAEKYEKLAEFFKHDKIEISEPLDDHYAEFLFRFVETVAARSRWISSSFCVVDESEETPIRNNEINCSEEHMGVQNTIGDSVNEVSDSTQIEKKCIFLQSWFRGWLLRKNQKTWPVICRKIYWRDGILKLKEMRF